MSNIFGNGLRFEEHVDHDGGQAIIMRRTDGSIFCAAIPGAALTADEGRYLVSLLNKGVAAAIVECEEGSEPADDRATSRRRQKVKAWRDQLKQKLSIAGVTPFYMVAAVPDGQHAYTEEQEREFQPQKRFLNHKSALANAWHMCRKFTRPFVVLGVCGIASPVLPDKTERDDEAAEGKDDA